MYVKLSFTILPFVTCAALIRMKVMFQITCYRLNDTVAYEGTTFTAIGEAPDLVCKRESSDERDRYAVYSCYCRVAKPFVTGRLSIRDYKLQLISAL